MASVHHGVDATALRAVLRQFHLELIALGDGATCGVHDFGVFFVYETRPRFVVRGEMVVSVPGRLVVKLRPGAGETTILAESPKVEIATSIVGPGEDWLFRSTSRADRFRVVTPIGHANEQYDWCRMQHNGTRRYILIRSDFTDTIFDTDDMSYDDGAGSVDFLRWSGQFDSWPWFDTDDDIHVSSQTFTARVAGDTVWGDAIADDLAGREALAWFRQRAIDIADR